MVLDLDPWDNKQHVKINRKNIAEMKKGDAMIWDNTYSKDDADIPLQEIEMDPSLEKIFTLKTEKAGHEGVFIGFVKK